MTHKNEIREGHIKSAINAIAQLRKLDTFTELAPRLAEIVQSAKPRSLQTALTGPDRETLLLIACRLLGLPDFSPNSRRLFPPDRVITIRQGSQDEAFIARKEGGRLPLTCDNLAETTPEETAAIGISRAVGDENGRGITIHITPDPNTSRANASHWIQMTASRHCREW